MNACVNCPAGKINLDDRYSIGPVFVCPDQTGSNCRYAHNTHSDCVSCTPGKYSSSGSTVCEDCVAGTKVSGVDD